MLINYLFLHRKYLMSKIFIAIVTILILILHLNAIYASQILEGFQYIDGFKVTFGFDYMNEILLVSEYILVFLGVYIGLSLANPSNQALTKYSVISKKSKLMFYLGRLLTGLMVIIIIIFINGLMVYILTSRFTPYAFPISLYFKQNFYLLIEVYQYFFLTILLMAMINHFLIGLSSLLIFWLYEVLYSTLPSKTIKITSILLINPNGLINIEKNIGISVSVYIFFTICYIIFITRKDC